MNELKTLKDIEDGFSSVFKITYAKALRQEAIKECNILSKCSAEDGSCGHADDAHTFLDNDSDSFSQNECVAVRQYIIWKNNLTDEELK